MEDVANDAELEVRELKRAGVDCDYRLVATAADFRQALEEFRPDVILSDFSMPQFDGMEALAIAQQFQPHVPLIFVSGTLGEDYAVRALKNGAADYVLKTNLIRLPSAVERAVQDAKGRQARRVLEQELQGSERRYRQLFESNPQPMWVYDVETLRFLAANDAAISHYGYSRDEFLAMTIEDIRPARELPRLADLVSAPLPEMSHSGTWQHRTRIGRTIDVHISSHGLVFGDRQARMVVAYDITERKQYEQELKASEYRLDIALEASALATWEWNLATGGVHFSRHWWPMLGYGPNEIALRIDAWEKLTDPDDLAQVKSMLAIVAKGLLPVFDVEYRMLAKNGEWRWIRSVGRVVERDALGRTLRLSGTHGDVTERKRAEDQLRRHRAMLSSAVRIAGLGSWDYDIVNNYLEWSDETLSIFGTTREAFGGTVEAFLSFVHPDDLSALRAVEIESSAPGSIESEYRIIRPDGAVRLIYDRGEVVNDASGHPIRRTGMVMDITERRNQEEKIARLSRIQAVLSGINSTIVRIREQQALFDESCRIAVEYGGFSMGWIATLDHESGKLVPVAQAGLPIGFAPDPDSPNRQAALEPRGVAEVALREKRPAFDNDMEAMHGFLVDGIDPDTLRIRRAAMALGAKSAVVLPLFVDERVFGVLTLYAPERNFFDDEELKLLTELSADISFALMYIDKAERVNYLAYYDPLTGLPNRSLFFVTLKQQLAVAARDRQNVALVLMDLDRFRMINATLGRHAGDAVLGAVAQRLKASFRDQDAVARVGADTFAVAISGSWQTVELARILESHNRKLFDLPLNLEQEEMRVSATTGVAVYPDAGESPEALFANAEAALRKAQEQQSRFLFYSPEMNARVAASLRLEVKLRRAIQNEELVLWYQPKLGSKTGKITGLEALMRWQDPETGLVPPAQFIPLMEQTGLILEAGNWALSQVAQDCAWWTQAGLKVPRVAVNVSPLQLRQKDFVAKAIAAADGAEQSGGALDLEITESVIMENVDAIIPILQTVRGLGVEIYIDDFGTGYSSLAYVARLPIHALKIDRSFVVGMIDSQESLAIVKSIVSLAHALKLIVVAEGVDSEEQATLLRQLDCDEMQGYLFSKPLPREELGAFLRLRQ